MSRLLLSSQLKNSRRNIIGLLFYGRDWRGDSMQNNLARVGSLQGKDVVMANALTRSAQGLNLAEKRIIFSVIAKMGGNFGEVFLFATEYAKTFDLAENQAYEQLKATAKGMRTRYFTLAVPDRKGVMKWEINWFSSIGYHDGEGKIGLKFNADVIPYLYDLEREFTKYKLKQACALRSVHSWRLLEQFEKHTGNEGKGWWTVSVDDFCTSMDASELQRKHFGKLRTQIIEPAIDELVKKDNWLIGLDLVKEGRKVVRLRFDFERNPQPTLF